ncbi:MAG: hypothetical protein ACYSR5_09295, partial [Planctomycetota bacterium]
MGSSNKYAPKITTILYMVILFLRATTVSANAPPGAQDIEATAKEVRLISDTFMQQSFELRMQYEYSGKFLTQKDKENLRELAKRAS